MLCATVAGEQSCPARLYEASAVRGTYAMYTADCLHVIFRPGCFDRCAADILQARHVDSSTAVRRQPGDPVPSWRCETIKQSTFP